METNIYGSIILQCVQQKNQKKWESLHNVKKVYINKEGLKSANIDFEEKKKRSVLPTTNLSKYREVGKS
jgi:hypothetical protein